MKKEMEEGKEEMAALQDQELADCKELQRLTFPHTTSAWPAKTLHITNLGVINKCSA